MNTRQLLLVIAAVAAPASAHAQKSAAPTGRCRLQFHSEHGLNSIKLPSGQFNLWTGGNVVARCPAQGLVMKSDSLESYGDEGRIVFIGHVDYVDPRLRLKSEQLTYFQREERLLAVTNVDARLPSGSTLRGPQVEFFRPIPKVRPQQSATATGRPTIGLVEKDAKGKPQPPVNVTGNTVWLQGDSIVSASGNVVVVRPELTATGDSLYADAGSGLLRLMRTPKMIGTKGRPFTLVGETIDLLTVKRKLNRVLAKSAAHATSEEMDLTSDTIDLRVTDDLLQRASAWGKSRAHATSLTQSILADSIDVLMPGQRAREMHAVRGASAEGMPDTTKFRTTERDRLTGDTVVAFFDSIPPKDTTTKPRMKEIIATGHASSLQHMAARDTCIRLPAINYVKGDLIRITFLAGRIDSVIVKHQDVSAGVYIEPKSDSTATCGASTITGVASPTSVQERTKSPALPAAPPGRVPPSTPVQTPAPTPAPTKRP